jgi:hypothetical protein
MPRTKNSKHPLPIKRKINVPHDQHLEGQSTTLDACVESTKPDELVPHVETGTSTVRHVVTKTLVEQAQLLISSAAAGDRHEEQEIAIYEAIRLLYPYTPKEGQVEALHHLIYRG